MRAVRISLGLALSLLVAACSLQIDQQDFSPSVDADTTDGPPSGVQLTPNPLAVMEGMSADITVRATSALASDVAVALTAEPPIIGLSQTSVVLTPSMPEVTVTVTALDDPDAVPGETVLTATSEVLGTTTASVDVAEDDELRIIATPEAITVNEDMSTELRVRLAAAPVGELTVTLMSDDTSIATVSDGTLEFSATNWDQDQTVTVVGSRDADDQTDTTPIHLTGTGVAPVDVGITVNDIDRLAILIGQGPFVVTEQQAPVQVGVRLSLPPNGNITITAAPGSAGIQLDTTSLMFTPQNYNTQQFISITGRMDADTEGFTTTVTLTASDVTVVALPFNVQVIDDDMQAILEDAANPLVVDEGQQVIFNAQLAFQPMDNVLVGISSTNPMAATVSPSVLTFTPTDWSMPKPVTVTGVDDQNTVVNSTIIRMAAAPLQTDVAVDVRDLDLPEILLINEPSLVTEGGTAGFSVRLRYEPPGPVAVNVTSTDSMAIAVTAGMTLNFNPTNYAMPQMVTLSAPSDIDVVEENATITVAATGFPPKTFNVTVDETSVINILPSAPTVTVTEEAAGVPFTVTLSNPPAGTLVVNLAPMAAGIQLSTSMLTFNSSNFSTPQPVTVTGLMDDDVAPLDTTISLTATGATAANVNVHVDEDDVQAIQEFAANPLTFNEGTQASFNIRLAFRPAAAVTVTVMSTNTNAATVVTGTVNFSTTDWNTLKPVTIAGVDDQNVATDTSTIQLRSGLLMTDVAVSVTDLDIQDVVLAMQPSMITEGSTANFTVRLAYQPPSATTVTVGSNDTGSVGVTVGSSLMFSTTNWATPQQVTLSAPFDIDLVDETVTITAMSGAFSEAFNVTVDDQTSITILPSTGSIMVTEQAAGQSFTVTLSNPPIGSMVVNVLPQSPGISVNNPTLTFNSGNYSTPQSVTVTALTDDNDADFTTSVNLTATGATSASVSVSVIDDDDQAILESAPATLDVIDPNGTAPVGVSFGVRLAFRPSGTINVGVASLASGVAGVSTGSLSFNNSNWDVEQTVTVTAAADLNMADGNTTVRLTSTGLTTVDIPVLVDDQDIQVVEVNSTNMTIIEGNSQNLGVRLRYQPAAGTTVTLSSSNGEVTVPATVAFTTLDYNMYKNASVATAVDGDNVNDTATITLGNFDAPATTMVGVTVTDITILETFGWPSPSFPAGSTLAGEVVAFQMQMQSVAATLDKIGLVAGGSGTFRIAIYADASNLPGTLVYAGNVETAPGAGIREIDVVDQLLTGTRYWIAVRTTGMSIGKSASTPSALRCVRSADITNINTNWPSPFGSCANAPTQQPVWNLYIGTFRQP